VSSSRLAERAISRATADFMQKLPAIGSGGLPVVKGLGGKVVWGFVISGLHWNGWATLRMRTVAMAL
jgi:hypothetical protein